MPDPYHIEYMYIIFIEKTNELLKAKASALGLATGFTPTVLYVREYMENWPQ